MDTCANCNGPLPENHHCRSTVNPALHFCDECATIHEALRIGARLPVMLYERGADAVSWTGAKLGTVVHKTPDYIHHGSGRGPFLTTRRRAFAPVYFRVRMLDGSMWKGTGPSANGNYIRLRPMKGT